jgi:hypothetical protein
MRWANYSVAYGQQREKRQAGFWQHRRFSKSDLQELFLKFSQFKI